MKIGTFYSGTIEELNGQSIKSKFFILGIPLFPISSFYFVSKTQGFELPLVGKSARIGFGRTLCLVIGILLTLLCLMYDDFPNSTLKIIAVVGAFLFMAITIYSWTSGQAIPRQERRTRLILEKGIGYNMLPSKLPRDTRITILQSILKKVDNKYSSFLLDADITSIDFDKNELPLLYSLSTYMASIKENKAASDFLEKYPAKKIYELCLENKANA